MDPNQPSSYLNLHCFQKEGTVLKKTVMQTVPLLGFLGTWGECFQD